MSYEMHGEAYDEKRAPSTVHCRLADVHMGTSASAFASTSSYFQTLQCVSFLECVITRSSDPKSSNLQVWNRCFFASKSQPGRIM